MQRQTGSTFSKGARATSADDDETYVERVAAAAHEGVEKVKERLQSEEENLREAGADAEEALREASDRVRDSYQEILDEAREYVREHPLTAAALAFAAGVVVISWIRR